MSTLPRLISGFTVIPVVHARATHLLYARAHRRSTSGAVTFPERRTLFLVNVPVDATDRDIARFFQPCGTVERVVWDGDSSGDADADIAGANIDADSHSDAAAEAPPAPSPDASPSQEPRPKRQPKRTTGKGEPAEKTDGSRHAPPPPRVVPPPPRRVARTLHKTGALAHVVFLDAASVEKAIALASASPTPRPWPSSEEPHGLAHHVAADDAQRPPLDVARVDVGSWMARFESELEAVDRAKKCASENRKGEAIVDEDGFTLVTRGGAYEQTLGGGVGVASKAFETTGSSGGGRKRKPKEKERLYAFQKAEKQRNALLNLRKNFEAAKARVEELKESRRFKPY